MESKSHILRINNAITATMVRLVNVEGKMVGVVPLADALLEARRLALDLVEINPTDDPVVCRIMDYGKYRYELKRKRQDAKKKQKTVELKEIQLRPNIGDNDYHVKLRSLIKFLSEGHKVKVTMRFRGRESFRPDFGLEVLHRMANDAATVGKSVQMPGSEGRQIMMMCTPINAAPVTS